MIMDDDQCSRKKLWAVIFLVAYTAFVGNYAYGRWFSAEPCYAEGNELRSGGKYKEAIAAYTKAIERDSKFTKAYMARVPLLHGEAKISDYNSLVNLEPQNPRWYQERAVCFVESQEFDVALSDCEKALEIDPDYTPALIIRGDIYRREQDYTNALADYNRVLEIDPANAEALEGRGRAYMSLKDYANAASDLTGAIKTVKIGILGSQWIIHRMDLQCLRGDAYRFRGDYDTALADYTAAIERGEAFGKRNSDVFKSPAGKQTMSKAYFGRGYIYHEQRDLVNAIENYTKVIELSSNAAAYNNRGNCYSDQGDYAQAISDYTKAIEQDSGNAMFFKNRGNVHRRLGNMTEAEADFAKAQELEGKK